MTEAAPPTMAILKRLPAMGRVGRKGASATTMRPPCPPAVSVAMSCAWNCLASIWVWRSRASLFSPYPKPRLYRLRTSPPRPSPFVSGCSSRMARPLS